MSESGGAKRSNVTDVKYCDQRAWMSVCGSVWLSAVTSRLQKNFSVHITRGRGPVLLWRQCNMLCTSGFMNDAMFSHSGPNTGTGLESATWRIIQRDSPGGAAKLRTRRRSLLSLIASLHFAWVVDDAKCIVVTRVCVSVCVSVYLSVRGRTPTLLHGPGCNLGAW